MGNSIWVVLKEVNQYDQEDEGYFMGAFANKPSVEDLAALDLRMDPWWADPTTCLEHIAQGGGRRSIEDVWYTLTEVPLL